MPPLKPVSQLDANQVLTHAFDEATQRLRTDSEATIVNADIDVALDASEDGVHIADKDTGSDLVVNPDGSINVDTELVAVLPNIENLAMSDKTQEYSYLFPDDTKKIFLKARVGTVRLSFISGGTSVKFITIPYGSSFTLDKILFSGSIYVKSSKDGDILEIMSWS